MAERKVYTLDGDLMPIMRGDVPLPNPEPIKGDIGALLLHYGQLHSGCSVVVPGKSKRWNVSFCLDHGQGGQLYGSGIVAWTEWNAEKQCSTATGLKFAICQHTKVDDPGANHSRGWHPGRCSKCGLDMTIDSGD